MNSSVQLVYLSMRRGKLKLQASMKKSGIRVLMCQHLSIMVFPLNAPANVSTNVMHNIPLEHTSKVKRKTMMTVILLLRAQKCVQERKLKCCKEYKTSDLYDRKSQMGESTVSLIRKKTARCIYCLFRQKQLAGCIYCLYRQKKPSGCIYCLFRQKKPAGYLETKESFFYKFF